MSVSGIEGIGGFTPFVAPTLGADEAARTQPTSGPAFGKLLVDGIQGLEAMQDKTDHLSVQAATGDLGAIHDYTIAATETSVATQLTVAVRNKAVEAFNEIMRMQV
ncbi:MAG TPA: flagellar hook-basal body complex protein FliE [Marmoricola sp.]|nr:flagellar hook-basal body complex protein FliE [Marmoricola sp.]